MDSKAVAGFCAGSGRPSLVRMDQLQEIHAMKSGVGIMIGLKVCVLAVAVMAASAATASDSWTVEVEGRPVRLGN